eukprot:scaffold41165_cov32-Prasinocladus_malaysianus.AAC.4
MLGARRSTERSNRSSSRHSSELTSSWVAQQVPVRPNPNGKNAFSSSPMAPSRYHSLSDRLSSAISSRTALASNASAICCWMENMTEWSWQS